MNNDQFRRLALGTGGRPVRSEAEAQEPGKRAAGTTPGTASHALGSRLRASIPMTPRPSVGGHAGRVAFARQMAERFQGPDRSKKMRSAVPKGSRLAQGYLDRAKMRGQEEAGADGDGAQNERRAAQLAALEEARRSGTIDEATYEQQRFAVAGGDLSSTHLVKGLDYRLLERVRNGEDVFREGEGGGDGQEGDDEAGATKADAEGQEPAEDVDGELERLEETAVVQTAARTRATKKGQWATGPRALAPGQKRTRDQILAELKAAREAAKASGRGRAAAAAAPVLGSRFKKIGQTQAPGSRVEKDSRGRDVLVIVDEDGHEKRKVRKARDGGGDGDDTDREKVRDEKRDAQVLGMEVPEFYRKKMEAEAAAAAAAEANKEVTIFDDVESDYDPLADLGGSASDSDSDSVAGAGGGDGDGHADRQAKKLKTEGPTRSSRSTSPGTSKEKAQTPRPQALLPPPAAAARRNYFKDSTTALLSEEKHSGPSLHDPAIQAALRKAKAMREAAESEQVSQEAERERRLKRLLANSERDAEDLDMGFGTNRLEDEEDMEEKEVKLSAWGDRGDRDGGGSGGSKAARKRGDKKRKGDGNNAADVLRILDQRREKGS